MQSENNLMKLILNRTSVRQYTDKKIEDDILIEIVRAGMSAPSARNIQPWSFIIVKDQMILIKLAEKLPYAKMLTHAAAAIVVCGIPDRENSELSDYWVQDCSAATENILLAVEALGLGAVWTGVFPRKDRIMWVKEVLSIPENIIPLNVIPLGYPLSSRVVKDKFNSEKIHLNKW